MNEWESLSLRNLCLWRILHEKFITYDTTVNTRQLKSKAKSDQRTRNLDRQDAQSKYKMEDLHWTGFKSGDTGDSVPGRGRAGGKNWKQE